MAEAFHQPLGQRLRSGRERAAIGREPWIVDEPDLEPRFLAARVDEIDRLDMHAWALEPLEETATVNGSDPRR